MMYKKIDRDLDKTKYYCPIIPTSSSNTETPWSWFWHILWLICCVLSCKKKVWLHYQVLIARPADRLRSCATMIWRKVARSFVAGNYVGGWLHRVHRVQQNYASGSQLARHSLYHHVLGSLTCLIFLGPSAGSHIISIHWWFDPSGFCFYFND